MNQKIMGILAALKNEHEIDSEDIGDDRFILNTNLSKLGDTTYILFEIRKQKE
jgi:hypothetical protein